MNKYLYIGSLILAAINIASSQVIWTVKDPQGNDILIHPDSSFMLNTNEKLVLFTVDIANQRRNVLVTEGENSYWLLNSGFDLLEDYTQFIPRNEGEYIFKAGQTWYITNLTQANTNVFYDNESSSNPHKYLRIFSTASISFGTQNLIIEAREKLSGDTVILYHTSSSNTTIPFGKKMRIKHASLPGTGSLAGNLIIASVFDEISLEWSEFAVYREYIRNLTRLHTMGPRNQYNVNFAIVQQEEFLVDHLDNGTKRALFYNSDNDTFTDFTAIFFPDFTLLELQNVKWTTYGFPLEPKLSYYDYYWKGRDQNNAVKYFISASLEDEEIVDLRGASGIDFMYSDHSSDSIYYYNYGNSQRGLNRAHIYNDGTRKDVTSIPFTSDFKLKGYKNLFYFGRYNQTSGQIEAIYKNVPQNKYVFIESTNGDRISNPLDFEFIDDKVFVVSKTTQGNKLIVFDPNGIVAVPDFESYTMGVEVFPNPSSGEVQILVDQDLLMLPDLYITIYDQLGAWQYTKRVTSATTDFKLNDLTSGLVYSVLTSEGKLILSRPIILNNK